MRRALVATMVAAAALCAGAPAVAAEDVTRVCRFTDERLSEISGMTFSLRHPDVIWLHNDSSGGPYIYAMDATTCETLARVTLTGIDARDIEAIASGRDRQGRPVLWVADIGDNLDSWPEVYLHRIREPKSLEDQSVTPTTFRFTYRDRPHNAEALLADPNSTQLWIVTKQLARGRLYALPKQLSKSSVNIAKPVGREGGLVTDGAVSPDGSRYVLRDYIDAQLFDGLPPGEPAEEIGLPIQPQGEAITWTPDGQSLLIASERDDRLLRVPAPAAQAGSLAPPADASPSSDPTASPIASPNAAVASDVDEDSPGLTILVAVALVVAAAIAGAVAGALVAVARRRQRGA